MAGVVHHGGAGTTAAGFRAGRPALITPLILDQFFNGSLVARHGAGPRPLPVKQWRADVLAERLKELTVVASYKKQAQAIAARMAEENGAARAAEVVRGMIGRHNASSHLQARPARLHRHPDQAQREPGS